MGDAPEVDAVGGRENFDGLGGIQRMRLVNVGKASRCLSRPLRSVSDSERRDSAKEKGGGSPKMGRGTGNRGRSNRTRECDQK